MATRSSANWRTHPGSFDPHHADRLFVGRNRYGIPELLPLRLERLPQWLVPYPKRLRAAGFGDAWRHFFLDDYRFETVWTRPRHALRRLKRLGQPVLTPDFSLYRDWPLAMQLWNVYRARWCGAFWQHQGLTVIPTAGWGAYPSYEFCFLGIPRGSVVAVAPVGVRLRQETERRLFLAGFAELLARVDPPVVISYGKLPAVCKRQVAVVEYPTRWDDLRRTRQTTGENLAQRQAGEAVLRGW